jgi:hypothetical protein
VYTTETGKSNYVWTLSPGGTKTAGGTLSSSSMTVTWNTSGAQWVKVAYRSGSCTAANPTNLNVTVNDPVTAGVIISASANPVDAGTPVTFDAFPINGGTSPAYLWKVNGSDIPGATNSSYTYIPANNDAVVCVLTSNASCVLENPATSNTIVMEVNGISNNLIVQNETVSIGQDICYNALDTITVAGIGTTFVVEFGGRATFIAGKAIIYLPGTKVDSGGYMLGQIAPDGPFCNGFVPLVSVLATGGVDDIPSFTSEQASFNIYPNPTSGNFTLVQTGKKQYGNVGVEVYSMHGGRIIKELMIGEKKHEFNMLDVPTGLYFVKIIAEDHTETIKVVKTK